jgi:hypothetical protein
VIRVLQNARGPICVAPNVASSEGKKIEERTMMGTFERAGNSVALPDSPEGQTWTPATTKEA